MIRIYVAAVTGDSGPRAFHRYNRVMIPPGVAAPARHRVVVLSLPGVLPLELGIAAQIFSMDPNYELTVACCRQAAPVARSAFSVTGPAGLDAVDTADTVIVPGYEDLDAEVPGEVLTGPGRGTRPRRADRVRLLRSVRPGSRRPPRRKARDDPLAGI